MTTQRKRRIPRLSFTATRAIGWHVSYRDPKTGNPKKYRFNLSDPEEKAEAERRYAQWLADHLNGRPTTRSRAAKPKPVVKPILSGQPRELRAGCLLEVANGLLNYEASRVRDPGSPRTKGMITREVYRYRCYYVRSFLEHINEIHGLGAVGRVRVDELTMQDVERYNRELVDGGLSSAAVKHAMQSVRHVIIRAGRPEHGLQVLTWNWESRDRYIGNASKPRTLPTLDQLRRILAATDLRGRTLIWTAIGLGFGPKDLAVLRVGQIDQQGYDLRRGKTGIDRYGSTPPLVWAYIEHFIRDARRPQSELVFLSHSGLPLVNGHVSRLQGWWDKLRVGIGESKDTMSGFYVLRHLGATEFGSREGCSISNMRRWLGHSASSAIADVYMRPVAPEHRAAIQWARERLSSSALDQ